MTRAGMADGSLRAGPSAAKPQKQQSPAGNVHKSISPGQVRNDARRLPRRLSGVAKLLLQTSAASGFGGEPVIVFASIASEQLPGDQTRIGADGFFNRARHIGVFPQKLLGVFTALPQPFGIIGKPRA